MEHTMMWVALSVGLTGWLFTFLLAVAPTRATRDVADEQPPLAVATPFLWLALLLPFVVWGLTLPTHPPFSAGQGWGRGFLLGGLASAVTVLTLLKAQSRPLQSYLGRSTATSPLFAAITMACIPLLWMRPAVIEALVGEALGWAVVSLVFLLGLKRSETQEENAYCGTQILNSAAFAAAICGVAALGVYRDFVFASVIRGTYPAVAMLLAGLMALTLLFGVLIGEVARGLRPGLTERQLTSLSNLSTVLLGLVLLLGLSALLGMKFLDDLSLTYVVGIGIALGYLLWWLVSDSMVTAEAESGEKAASRLASLPVAGMLVALSAFMLAYQIMQGFGVGLMLVAAWPVSLLSLPTASTSENREVVPREVAGSHSQTTQVLTLFFSFVAVLLLSRLFEMRFRADLRGSSLGDQFALFGFLGGAVLPSVLASLWSDSAAKTSRSWLHLFPVRAALPRLFLLGLLTLALPSAAIALWGAKILPAFFAGLALATVFGSTSAKASMQSAGALFSLSIALTLTQWTHHFAPLAESSRAQRLHFLLWGLGSLLVLLLVLDYGSRLFIAASGRKTPHDSPEVSR